MTNPRLAAIDARIHRVAARAGLADVCTFRPKQGAAVPDVRCYVRRGVQFINDNGQVTSNETVVDLIRVPDLPRPLRDDQIELADGLYRVSSAVQAADESRFSVLVVQVTA
ncbi:MAG: hypothetical protein ACK5PG_06155 [Lysobacterales bacterium]|jgi:hypothetical protein